MKPHVANFILFFFSLVISLLICESIIRMFNLSKTWEINKSLAKTMNSITMNDSIGYLRTKNTVFVGPGDVTYRINNMGFRDKNFTQQNPKKKKRISFLGDSVTEGFGLEENSRFTNLVDSALTDEYETMNFAVAGFSPWNEYRVLKTHTQNYSLDFVFLQLCFNDFAEDKYRQLSNAQFNNYEVKKNSFKSFIQQHSALYLFAAEKYQRLKLKMNMTNNVLNESVCLKEEDLQITYNYLQQIDSICQINKIKLCISYFPSEGEVLTENDTHAYYINNSIESFCRLNGIQYLNCITELRNEKENLFLDDCHLNIKGHQVVGKLIVNYLK